MRILLLNDGATPVGGAELQALRLRELLQAAGHHVRLLASTASELPLRSQADVTCFGTTRPKLRVVTQTANPSAAAALRRELRHFRPDVVHIRMYLTQLSPLVLPLLRDVPTVWQAVYYKAICPRGTKLLPDGSPCTVHSGTVCLRNRCVTPQSWVMDMAQQRLWRRWADAIDAVVTLSDVMRRRLEDEGVPGVRVIPNGVRRRPARPPLTDPPTIAFAGRLVLEKGADVLLHAFGRVVARFPDTRLLIAGEGPQRATLQALARRLDVAEHTQFLGHLDRARLERRFDRAWIQVVPGRWDEPLGNVTLEFDAEDQQRGGGQKREPVASRLGCEVGVQRRQRRADGDDQGDESPAPPPQPPRQQPDRRHTRHDAPQAVRQHGLAQQPRRGPGQQGEQNVVVGLVLAEQDRRESSRRVPQHGCEFVPPQAQGQGQRAQRQQGDRGDGGDAQGQLWPPPAR